MITRILDSSVSMVGKKVGNLSLYMCFTFQNNSCNGIPKSIVHYSALTPAWALKQINTQIINGMSTLTTWKCAIVGCGKPRWVLNIVKKWTKDKWNVGVVGWINNKHLWLKLHKTRDVQMHGIRWSIY
jgi:hypothetical protein